TEVGTEPGNRYRTDSPVTRGLDPWRVFRNNPDSFGTYGAESTPGGTVSPHQAKESLPGVFGWSDQQPVDRRLNETGAEVEVSRGVGLEAHLQAACAFACEPIEAARQQHAGEAATLVLVLDAHRLDEPNERRGVEPEQRVAGEVPIRVLDRKIERRIVERALSQACLDLVTVPSDHRVRTIRAGDAIDEREPVDLRDRRPLVGLHPCGPRQLVGHRESAPDGEVRQRRVALAHEHLECALMPGGRLQGRSPDL